MKVVAIIQARSYSTRLPGKVLMPLAGHPMLWHIINRAKRSKLVNEVVVGIPQQELCDMDAICEELDIDCLDGGKDENDLIGRFYDIADFRNADIIVRLCADNPFVEGSEIDRAVNYFLEQPRIFVSNMHDHSPEAWLNGRFPATPYPDGIGCEVFSMSTLKWMHEKVHDKECREHPHKIFHDLSLVESPTPPYLSGAKNLKLDVNDMSEYLYAKDIYDSLYEKNNNFNIVDVIAYLDKKRRIGPTVETKLNG